MAFGEKEKMVAEVGPQERVALGTEKYFAEAGKGGSPPSRPRTLLFYLPESVRRHST